MQNETKEKKVYGTPKLIVHGNVSEVTLANNPDADMTDAVFPVKTPRRKLTFGS